MIKFRLKRKITGKKLKALKRQAEKSQEVVVANPVWGHTITFKPLPYRRDFAFDHNKPVGRKYPIAIYELEEKAPKKVGLGYGSWEVVKLLHEYKKKGQKSKLKRLYKAFPSYSPEYKRQQEHKTKVKAWQEKLYKNHVKQCQSLTLR